MGVPYFVMHLRQLGNYMYLITLMTVSERQLFSSCLLETLISYVHVLIWCPCIILLVAESIFLLFRLSYHVGSIINLTSVQVVIGIIDYLINVNNWLTIGICFKEIRYNYKVTALLLIGSQKSVCCCSWQVPCVMNSSLYNSSKSFGLRCALNGIPATQWHCLQNILFSFSGSSDFTLPHLCK